MVPYTIFGKNTDALSRFGSKLAQCNHRAFILINQSHHPWPQKYFLCNRRMAAENPLTAQSLADQTFLHEMWLPNTAAKVLVILYINVIFITSLPWHHTWSVDIEMQEDLWDYHMNLQKTLFFVQATFTYQRN